MSNDTVLIEKREELKRRLAAGEYKTLVDIFLERFDRLIRKIIHQSKPLPIWFITAILSIVLILIDSAALYVTGDMQDTRIYVEQLGLGYGLGVFLLWWFSIGVLTIISMIVINRYIGRILKLWQDTILDATESLASLEEFEDWLAKTCNPRLHLLATIIGGLLLGSFLTVMISIQYSIQYGEFVGYGWTFAITIASMLIWAFTHLFLMVILLSAKLRRYDLKLFAADPGSSELASRLSGELNLFIYFVGIYTAILTLTTALVGFLAFSVIFFVLLYGLSLTTLFVLNQTSLSSIIRRAKWKTLNEIQAKVEKLQAVENFEDKETMEAINRLMDYHDRVKATRNSAVDLRAVLGFINSLLLPLIAFILGNLDLVLNFFARKP